MKKLLQRGSYEDLSRQWQPYGRKQQNWEFSRILNDDQIQKLTTSGLIDAMKNPGKFPFVINIVEFNHNCFDY